jgi:hypothetical protein
MHLASSGFKIPLARGRPNTAGSSKTKATSIILRRRQRPGGPRQALHLMSNPQRGVDGLWALLSVDAFASVRVQLPSRRGRPCESPRAAICSLLLAQIVPRSLTTRKVLVPVIGASYSPFFLSICFSFLGIWGFLFSNYFFNYLFQESAIIVAGADPAMSSEALGGLPQAQTTCQGSPACGRPGQQEGVRSNRKGKS